MDWMKLPEKLWNAVKKYRYAVLVLALGLVFMAVPRFGGDAKAEIASSEPQALETDFSQELADILSRIEGVGKVEVLLTQASGAETLYQTDPDASGGLDTVILSRGSGLQEGLVRQINPPAYQGAIVVCQGGGSDAVRLQVVEAVSRVTGLGADQISVSKMN